MKMKGVSQYVLINVHNISESELTRLRRNETVKTVILNKLCAILDCGIDQICRYVKDETG